MHFLQANDKSQEKIKAILGGSTFDKIKLFLRILASDRTDWTEKAVSTIWKPTYPVQL